MEGSHPEHYTIADFLKWHEDKELILNPKFQRGTVWLAPARSYLIDSILRGYPLPKLLLRTKIDRDAKRTIRDVVDGQQRLRTIIAFAEEGMVLGTKAGDFNKMRYVDLSDELKDQFLSYKLTCEQLINASDEDVLEVFIRINSYTVPVNDPELRNAQFDNDFSRAVKTSVTASRHLWELGVLSDRARVRMLDQSLMAEIYGLYVNGVTDSDEKSITRLYRAMNSRTARVPSTSAVQKTIDETVSILGSFKGERLVQRPQLLMVLATIGYIRGDIGPGRLDITDRPPVSGVKLGRSGAQAGLSELNTALTVADPDELPDYEDFIEASRSSTQRIRSRQVRFQYFYDALTSG